ncbi:MAG: magnesium transporter CorA [Chloroflexi bacterium]|nr:magnesium transporter CorA [Chloroflexota bacterium]
MATGINQQRVPPTIPGTRPNGANGIMAAVAPEKSWFCTALMPTGETVRIESDTMSEILGVAQRAVVAWADCWVTDMARDAWPVASAMGFSELLVTTLLAGDFAGYEDYDTEMGLMLPAIQVREFEVTLNPILMLLRRNFVLSIHTLNVDKRFFRLRRYAETFLKKIPANVLPEDSLTMLLIRIIDDNNERNFDHLREIEEQGDKLNEDLINPNTPRSVVGRRIYEMKHALITYLNGLWVTVDVLNTLRYGDAELITNEDKLLERLGILSQDVNRQIALSEHLSEVLASGLEVLQSIYNNQLQILNNRMALAMTYFTIIGAAVLVPNTLATILSNPAFGMGPQDAGWYTVVLIASTIVATLLTYWLVRRKHWIPTSVE